MIGNSTLRLAAFGAALVPALLLFSGCATKTETATEMADRGSLEERMLGEKMLKAFKDKDSKAFLALLPPETRKRFGEKEFQSARSEIVTPLGEPVSYEYVTDLQAPVLHPMIWKVRFHRLGSNKQPIEQDALFRIIVGKLDDKPWILSFGFL